MKMIVKGRNLDMRLVSGTHRVGLDGFAKQSIWILPFPFVM